MEMKNKPDAFEQALRQSLDHYEVPYNSADWAQLDRSLSKSDAKQGRWSLGLLALLFGGVVALSGTMYQLLADGGTEQSVATAQHDDEAVHALSLIHI